MSAYMLVQTAVLIVSTPQTSRVYWVQSAETGKTEAIPWAVPEKARTGIHGPTISLPRDKMKSSIFHLLALC